MEDLLMQIEGKESLSMYKILIINYIEKNCQPARASSSYKNTQKIRSYVRIEVS